ncbi:flavodoxin [Ruminococcus sp. Marseille-P6503]|uniref:flavodoxin n=1 Tax=Ruminococcus sp. Marseille-P6503 TaxID=2364796 RepID=UPI000F532941|nr:flavodoxin [Ruminococcus sp. Marseille-P6503]
MSKRLVAFFSAGGVTAKLAERLAKAAGADIFEIRPEQPYTREDLDWTNRNSRSSVEMADKSFRPAVAGTVENMEQYDVIYVGFPIWWYVAPTIINTFLEQYDLAGKTVVPFATSGGSGMGRTNAELAVSCKGARLAEGKRFGADASESELKKWSEGF